MKRIDQQLNQMIKESKKIFKDLKDSNQNSKD